MRSTLASWFCESWSGGNWFDLTKVDLVASWFSGNCFHGNWSRENWSRENWELIWWQVYLVAIDLVRIDLMAIDRVAIDFMRIDLVMCEKSKYWKRTVLELVLDLESSLPLHKTHFSQYQLVCNCCVIKHCGRLLRTISLIHSKTKACVVFCPLSKKAETEGQPYRLSYGGNCSKLGNPSLVGRGSKFRVWSLYACVES